MAPDEDIGLLCDVAQPNVPTGSYFSLRAAKMAEHEDAGVFTQRVSAGCGASSMQVEPHVDASILLCIPLAYRLCCW